MNPIFIKFNVLFSIENLQKDLMICESEIWTNHFNIQQYNGEWSSVALRSASGQIFDINSFANHSFVNTFLFDKCVYFKEVIDWFKCEKEAIRLLKLAPNSEIKEHIDNDTSYDDGFFRIHIPIRTNNEVFFYVNKVLVPMQMGECWYANFQLPHSVQNKSNETRVHLVIDCKRNEWSDKLFTMAGYNIKTKSKNNLPNEIKHQIIKELLLNPTPVNLELARKLQSEIDSK